MKNLRREDVDTAGKLSMYLIREGVKDVGAAALEILKDYDAEIAEDYAKALKKLRYVREEGAEKKVSEYLPDLQFSILRWEFNQLTAAGRKAAAKAELKRINDKMVAVTRMDDAGVNDVEANHIDSDSDLCAAVLVLSRALPGEFQEICDDVIYNFCKTERYYS